MMLRTSRSGSPGAAPGLPKPAVRIEEVDVALVYYVFTFNAISWFDALGLCGLEEAQDWLVGGRRIALDGELPVNPHGGQLSEGRTHGFGFIYEAVLQLRNGAGYRQVTASRIAQRPPDQIR